MAKKLIDADALKGEFDPKLFGLSVIYRAIDSAPDASEPLRERVRELQEALKGCVASMKELNWGVEYGRTDYHTKRLNSAEALLKGDQDDHE